MSFCLPYAAQAKQNTRQDPELRPAWPHEAVERREIKLALGLEGTKSGGPYVAQSAPILQRQSHAFHTLGLRLRQIAAGRIEDFRCEGNRLLSTRANCVLHPGEGLVYSVAAEAAAASSSDWSWRSHPDRVCLDRLKAAGSMEAAVVTPSALMVREIGSGMWSRSAQLKIS